MNELSTIQKFCLKKLNDNKYGLKWKHIGATI